MSILNNKEKLRPYIWAVPVFFLLQFGHSVSQYPESFFAVLFNNLWNVAYVIVLNFILFEYSIPFVLRKRKTIIYNILLGILLLFLYMMLYSYGSHGWRLLGIQLHIYTPLGTFKSLDILLESREKSLTLALEIKRTRRRASHDLSESQRFFIDIALRMAFAEFSSPGSGKAPLYIDTPEGSLDLAYEEQAGKMIAKFAKTHRVFMTANVNTSQLLRSIANHSRASGLSIQRLYQWTELSEVQAPQERKFDRTLNEIEKLAKPKKK